MHELRFEIPTSFKLYTLLCFRCAYRFVDVNNIIFSGAMKHNGKYMLSWRSICTAIH